MRIVADRAIALLHRLMCDHCRIQVWLVAVAASRPHWLFEQCRLHAGMGIVTVQTGRACCLQVMRLREFLGGMTRSAKLVTGFDQKRLLGAAVRIVTGVACSIDNRRVDTRRLRQDFCGHILMAILT